MNKQMNESVKIRFGSEWYDNIYAENVTCSNCGAREQVLIRKGVSKKQALPIECPHCGCEELQ